MLMEMLCISATASLRRDHARDPELPEGSSVEPGRRTLGAVNAPRGDVDFAVLIFAIVGQYDIWVLLARLTVDELACAVAAAWETFALVMEIARVAGVADGAVGDAA